jgi:osmotically-inducible protein OsmY
MLDTDSEIRRAVLLELHHRAHLTEPDVDVEVNDGVVTLTGRVSSWAKRTAAQTAAHHVPTVRDVANDIEVSPARYEEPTDTQLAHAVRCVLDRRVPISAPQIHSTVWHGQVRLEGEVEFLTEREDAEWAVREVPGVRKVLNKLRLR